MSLDLLMNHARDPTRFIQSKTNMLFIIFFKKNYFINDSIRSILYMNLIRHDLLMARFKFYLYLSKVIIFFHG